MEMIDLDLLLAPVSPESPAGEALRYEGIYDQIQEARREDDPNLSQGIWQTTVKKADWALVHQLSLEALQTRSKDLQIAVWLLEARMNLYGYAGVRSGVQMINALCERFWEVMYPELSEDDIEYRISPFEWMNQKLSIKIKQIPITRPASYDSRPYCWIDLEGARILENAARKDPKVLDRVDEESVTLFKFNSSVIQTPDEFFRALYQELEECLDALAALDRFLDEKCGNQAPGFKHIRDMLTSVRTYVTEIFQQRGGDPPAHHQEMEVSMEDVSSEEDVTVSYSAAQPVGTGSPAMTIRSRSEAYSLLSMIADYLMRVEPHSPTPYLVKRAVSWGNMPLASLLQELMQGNNDLGNIYKLLGIKNLDSNENNR